MKEDKSAKWVTIIVSILILFQLIRSCSSKSNDWHSSDPEMNRVR